MIETKDITKMVKHIVRRDQGARDPQIMHPSREWFTGLSLVTLIVVFGSWFCFYTYNNYIQQINGDVPVVESSVPYQAAVVDKAVQSLIEKRKTYQSILETKTQNTNPAESTPKQPVQTEHSDVTSEVVKTEQPQAIKVVPAL